MHSQSTPDLLASSAVVLPTAPTLEPLTYSVTETATVLGVSLPTVYRLLARGVLRPLPGLRHKRLPKKQVHAFVDGARSAGW